jgi:hypothetical protein
MGKSNRFKTPNQKMSSSKGEKELYELLKKMWPFVKIYYDYPVNNLTEVEHNIRFDVYVQTYQIAFEFDGTQHTKPVAFGNSEEEIQASLDKFKKQQEFDLYKKMICDDIGIRLVRIPEDEWKSIKTVDGKREYLMERISD